MTFMSSSSSESAAPVNRQHLLVKAFVVGAVVHAVLLALGLSGVFDAATWLLLVFALPGAVVDISAEMIHPSQTGGVILAGVATLVNGGAYALGVWLFSTIKRR